MRDILAYSKEILSRLHHHFPEAVVVGGAVRDALNNKSDTIKDIDVVVFDRPGYLLDLKLDMLGYQHRVAVNENVANYLAFENVVCVHEFFYDHTDTPIQVIVMREFRSIDEILQRHDFGFCQVGYDGERLWWTPAYTKDAANKTFTLVRCRDEKDYWRSVGRFQRLQTKYPDFTMAPYPPMKA